MSRFSRSMKNIFFYGTCLGISPFVLMFVFSVISQLGKNVERWNDRDIKNFDGVTRYHKPMQVYKPDYSEIVTLKPPPKPLAVMLPTPVQVSASVAVTTERVCTLKDSREVYNDKTSLSSSVFGPGDAASEATDANSAEDDQEPMPHTSQDCTSITTEESPIVRHTIPVD